MRTDSPSARSIIGSRLNETAKPGSSATGDPEDLTHRKPDHTGTKHDRGCSERSKQAQSRRPSRFSRPAQPSVAPLDRFAVGWPPSARFPDRSLTIQ